MTEREKLERHLGERRAIVAAYKARLEAAGVYASWVDVAHPSYAARMLSDIDAAEVGEA